MLSKVIFATGIVFWCLMLYFVVRLVAELIWASIATASWLRFLWRAARLRGANRYPSILKMPGLFSEQLAHVLRLQERQAVAP